MYPVLSTTAALLLFQDAIEVGSLFFIALLALIVMVLYP
jgi:hypothetical protein